MESLIEIVLYAGRGAIEVALYTLLPIMVVMMILLRALEAWGVLDWAIRWLGPVAYPFGLTGLGVLAMVQISFVSFVAPLPTLALMESRGVSDRHLAAALAAVLAMAPANALFPMATLGLQVGPMLALSALGGLVAASSTYWLFGKKLSVAAQPAISYEREGASSSASLLKIINTSGSEAIQIVINIIPLLLVSLAVVAVLQQSGAINTLEEALSPIFGWLGIEPNFTLPTLTKYLAGSTALIGVAHEMETLGHLPPSMVSAGGAGFLLHPLDLPGVAILLSAGPRLGRSALPAIVGGCMGIFLRTVLGSWLG